MPKPPRKFRPEPFAYHEEIELQVDNVPEEKFAEYFENGEFAENPIGVTFDPDALTAQLAAGVPEEDLLKRPDGAPPDISEFPVN